MKCECGGDEFLARQAVRGAIDVVVDAEGAFLENATQDGAINPDGLNFDEPEGPFLCRKCGKEWRGWDAGGTPVPVDAGSFPQERGR